MAIVTNPGIDHLEVSVRQSLNRGHTRRRKTPRHHDGLMAAIPSMLEAAAFLGLLEVVLLHLDDQSPEDAALAMKLFHSCQSLGLTTYRWGGEEGGQLRLVVPHPNRKTKRV